MSHFGKNTGESAPGLAALRAEIDAVDAALHDLLMRRSDLTAHMGALKAGRPAAGGRGRPGNPYRPAREAVILRRLAARHSGCLPFDVVVQIWRELIAANLRRQCAFELALAETGDGRLRDLARSGFGTLTRATVHSRVQDVIEVVSESPGTLGVLPAPMDAPPELRMWPELLAAEGAPRILCALPLLAIGHWPEAFVIGQAPGEASGDDLSLLLLTGTTSRAAHMDELAHVGLNGRIEGAWPSMSPPGHYCRLAVVQGFLKPSDPALTRLKDLRRNDGGTATLIGVAPAPIRPPDGRDNQRGRSP